MENIKAIKTANDTNTPGALKVLSRSRAFTPYKELAHQNLVESMKHFGQYQKFRELTKDAKGRYTKFDPNKVEYKEGYYLYDNHVKIVFDNSPESLDVFEA